MFDLTHPSPSPGAFKAQPFSASEIDTHPDCDRIWKTIEEMREGARLEIDAAEDAAEQSFGLGFVSGSGDSLQSQMTNARDAIFERLRSLGRSDVESEEALKVILEVLDERNRA